MSAENWLSLASALTLLGLLLWGVMLTNDWRDLFPRSDDDERQGWLPTLIELRRREQRRQKWARFRIGR